MSKVVRWIGIVVGAGALLLLLIGVIVHLLSRPPRNSVVEMKIEGDIGEVVPPGLLGRLLGGRKLTLREDLEAILKARDDDRVSGLLLDIDDNSLGFASVQELRQAISDFRAHGKWATAWLETAGDFAPGNKEYYLASACDTIWLAPSGDINLYGVRMEVPFIRGTLDKLGVYPDFDHIGKYKNAMNFYTKTAMDAAHREAMESIIGALYAQLRDGIAAGRKMTGEAVAALIDRGPFTAQQALQAGLVDHLGYRDEMEAAVKERNGGRLPLLRARAYLEKGGYYDRGVRIALIYGVGTVSRGDSDYTPFLEGPTMGSDTVAKAIRDAREDPRIKAIILRVNSPGGSYVASDVIWREVSRTRGVKPIIVSMSDLAASGGYFVSVAADRILAQPGTLTASIGVLGGKLVTTEFWNRIGFTTDAVQRGRHATFYSSTTRYSPEERAIFESWLKRVYDDFVAKVAQGRGKTVQEIDAVAQGRVWTGDEALRLGLVDEIGGLSLAVRRALELAKLDPDSRAQLVVFPAPTGLVQTVLSGGEQTGTALTRMRADLRGLLTGTPPVPGEQVLRLPFIPELR
jgi:protease IV